MMRCKIWRVQPRVWAFTVFIGEDVIFTDNGGDWRSNLDNALSLIAATQEIQRRGYRLEYTDEQVAEWYAGLQVGVPS